jgi:hypothetical protein
MATQLNHKSRILCAGFCAVFLSVNGNCAHDATGFRIDEETANAILPIAIASDYIDLSSNGHWNLASFLKESIEILYTDENVYAANVDLFMDALADDALIAGNGYFKKADIKYTGERALVFSAANLPEGLTISPKTGVIIGGVEEVGSHVIVVIVTDGKLRAHAFYIFNVKSE